MIDASKPTSTHTWLAAVLAALISALFFGLNAVASKLLFSPAAPAHFDAVSLFVARGFWSLPLFLVLALATMRDLRLPDNLALRVHDAHAREFQLKRRFRHSAPWLFSVSRCLGPAQRRDPV